METYKEAGNDKREYESTKGADMCEEEFLEQLKDTIFEINEYINSNEVIENIKPLEDLYNIIGYDYPRIIKIIEDEHYIPSLLHHLTSTEDICVISSCLKCISALATLFPDQKSDGDYEVLLQVYDFLVNNETKNVEALYNSILSLTAFMTVEAMSGDEMQEFYMSLVGLVESSEILYYACALFAYNYIRIVDSVKKDSAQMCLVFAVIIQKKYRTNIFSVKILYYLIKRKFISLDEEPIQEIIYDYLEKRDPEIMRILLKGISLIDERHINLFENERFYNYIREIINISDDSHNYDKMKTSAYSTLARFSQLAPHSNKELFFGNEKEILQKIFIATYCGGINVKIEAGTLLSRLFYAFPSEFVDLFIAQDDDLTNAVITILGSELSASILLIKGLEEVSNVNKDALFAMGEAGIIDEIENLTSNLDDDISETATSFIDYAHEIFDESD